MSTVNYVFPLCLTVNFFPQSFNEIGVCTTQWRTGWRLVLARRRGDILKSRLAFPRAPPRLLRTTTPTTCLLIIPYYKTEVSLLRRNSRIGKENSQTLTMGKSQDEMTSKRMPP